MVSVKPKLAAFLDLDENDFDLRALSDSITKSFPWPIGIELRRLLSANMEKLDRGRLDQIVKTIERIMQFLCFIMIIQLNEEALEKALSVPENLKKEFLRRFSILTLGNYTSLIRLLGKIFKDNDITPFCEELNNFLDNRFYKKLDFWVPDRNDISHFQINLNQGEIEVRCVEYLDRLEDILSDLVFIIKYPMIFIKEIQLIKQKRGKEKYSHKMEFLNSSSSIFSGQSIDLEKYTDSQNVLLVKNLKNPPQMYLNLFPLIISTQAEQMESKKIQTKVKEDVYLYTKWDEKEKRIHFVGTQTTEKVDLRLISCYDCMVTQFEEILNNFSSKE
jgi:hypothetical protein